MSELAQDVRYGLRRLRLAPGFTLAVVLVLGLGIGATTAIFSVLDAALLRPLPYPEPERLVTVEDLQDQGETPSSFSEYASWKQATDVFADLGAWWQTTYVLTGTGEPERLSTRRMSADVPRILGVVPLAGRSFAPGEDERSAPPVVMLGESFWRRRFNGDPKIIGRALTLEGEPYTVIGVFPDSRRSIVPSDLAAGQKVDIWLNLRLDSEVTRDLHFLNVVGRLRSGLTLAQAEERVDTLAHRLRDSGVAEHDIAITRLERTVLGDSRPLLTALAGAAGMVLLIACTNVASLLLARAAGRRREIAIRAALGAARGRIVRQLLVESLILALLGGGAGALLARIGVDGLRALGTSGVPRLDEAAVDLRMLGFALVLSLLTGLLFGLVPVLRASRPNLGEVIKTGAPGALGGPARDRLRGALVVAEVALSFALLIGAGLLLRSLDRLLAVDKGFDTEHVVSAYLNLPYIRYDEKHEQAAFFQTLRERLLALPGVREAAFASDLPLVGDTNGGFAIEGRTFPPDAQPIASKRIVSPGYFAALGTRVLAGRPFDERDVAGAAPVVMVNQAFANRYFPNENPLGKRMDFSWETTGMQGIVGVIADVRELGLAEPAQPTIYIPLAQRPDTGMFLLVRTAEEPLAVVPSLRRAVYALDRDLPLSDVRTLADILDRGLADRHFAMSLFAAFSTLALGLAAVGLYAVISYSVLQRRREIGIRMALGARAEQVGSAVVGRGIGLITAGAALGALASLWLGRFLAGLIFGVGTTDPATFASVAFVLMATALLASLVPALRAARIDPARVLRSE